MRERGVCRADVFFGETDKEEAWGGGGGGVELYIICRCGNTRKSDGFINNESRKTGQINPVNKCAVSSAAPGA